MTKAKERKLTAKELAELEADEGVTLEKVRVNLDLPVPVILILTREAKRIGIARQALIKMVLSKYCDSLVKEQKESA